MKVHNIQGTSDNEVPRPYKSWIEFWQAHKIQLPYTCPRCGKRLTDPVGAHVQKDSIWDRRWYIAPICRGCNQANTSFYVDESLFVRITD